MGHEQDEQMYSELLRLLTIIRRLYPNFNSDRLMDRLNAAIYDYANELSERMDINFASNVDGELQEFDGDEEQ